MVRGQYHCVLDKLITMSAVRFTRHLLQHVQIKLIIDRRWSSFPVSRLILTGIGQSAEAAVSTPPQIIELLEAMPPSTVQMAPLT